ncbi:MAG: PQQ-dependent sugar dehydrogenase, partial [Myxococcota bacterium]
MTASGSAMNGGSLLVVGMFLCGCGPAAEPRTPVGTAPDPRDDISADGGDTKDASTDAGLGDAGGLLDAGPALPPYVEGTTCQPLGAELAMLRTATVEDAYPGLRFSSPLFLTAAAGSPWNFVIEQGGRVYVFDGASAAPTKTLFLDLSDVVEAGGEKGLLGFALHPEYDDNRTFFVSYTERDGAQLTSVIARYMSTTSAGMPTVQSGSEEVLLKVEQPYDNHNGGMLAFGPDGFLYIALGDGGSGGDPLGHGQNVSTLLGALLRIDVDTVAPPLRYGIPDDNPFASGAAGAKEIVAYGLRNPWRFSFDETLGDLWIADVGQGAYEEVNHLPFPFPFTVGQGAVNFGWNQREGFVCYPSGDPTGYSSSSTAPVVAYDRSAGQSVTGGYVYRGSAYPALVGNYFFADFALRRGWSTTPGAPPGL